MVSVSYIIKCWHCMAEFDAVTAADCGHFPPSKICPFCLKCFCSAADEYKSKYVKNCPKEFLAQQGEAGDAVYRKIGEILIKAGKISIEQLDTALGKQPLVNKKLGEVLIMMSLITPDELQLYLLNQKNIERIDLNKIPVDMNLIHQIGREFCLNQKIVPIEIQEVGNGQVLRFAFYSVNELSKLKKKGELKKYQLIPYLARKEEIENLLKNLESSDKEIKIYTSQESARHVRILNALVKSAMLNRVSDIFFELKSGQLGIFFRNGELLSRVGQPIDDPKEFFEKLKEICGFKRGDKHASQESWLNLSKNFSHLKIKVFYYFGAGQESIHLKINNLKDFAKKIADLNLESDELERVQAVLRKPGGLIIVAGPVFSKTNETFYTLMNTLVSERIATVESDVLLRNERFFQIENPGSEVSDAVYNNLLLYKTDSMFLFDFLQKNYGHSFLDFVKVGKLFIELQGFSYEDMFEKMQADYDVLPSFWVEQLRLVMFQRQVKILCPHCKIPDPRSVGELFKNKKISGDYQIFQEKGCQECQASGYSHDQIFYEIFVMENKDRGQFQAKNLATLDKIISETGNPTIAQKVLNRVLKGEISYKESSRFF
jgi:type IV pilus assembly protein PilB